MDILLQKPDWDSISSQHAVLYAYKDFYSASPMQTKLVCLWDALDAQATPLLESLHYLVSKMAINFHSVWFSLVVLQ